MDPHAIIIHCDGAADYDSKRTGGNGFIVEFPDTIDLKPVTKSIRNDGQGIHRLEMISVIEAMRELLTISKRNSGLLRQASGVVVYTDRISITDSELSNPYRIQVLRKNKWKTHEGKDAKDTDLLNEIDKLRKKVNQEIGGRVEIKYKREKKNKVADKLSKIGKITAPILGSVRRLKRRNVARRLHDGSDVNYSSIHSDEELKVRIYAWELVRDQYEICTEIVDGSLTGKICKVYTDSKTKQQIHRHHTYLIIVENVYAHHITVRKWTEYPVADHA